jgi:hypothetical protein
MSIENHPNFHAVNFTTRVMAAYYESLRGGALFVVAPDISCEVIAFANKIEDMVDINVEHDKGGR